MSYPIKKLEEVIKFLPKSLRRAGDGLDNGKFPFFTSSPIQKKFFNVVDYKEEAIILGTGGSASIHICKNFSTSADVFIIKSSNKDRLENKYLYLFLVANILILNEGFKGAALKHLSKEYLKNIEIPLPPLSEQKKIVAKLEELLAKVNEAKKLRTAAQEATSQLLPAELHKIFEEGKKKGWEEKNLGEVCEIARGGSPRPIKDYLTTDEDGINWIKISDATQSTKYIYETKQKIRKEGLHKTRLVKSGDFILTNSMSFGRPYIMRTEGAIHDGWLVLRPQEGLLEEYMYHFLSSDEIYYQFSQLAGGAVVQNLNSELVRSVKILIPPLTEQKKIVARLDSISEKAKQLKEYQKATHDDLLALEQSILSKAFSGEFV